MQLSYSSFNCFLKLDSNIDIKEIKWPEKSSHLSPILSIWRWIEGSIRLQRNQPRNCDELWNLIEDLWEGRRAQPLFWKGVVVNLQCKLRVIAAKRGERMEDEEIYNYFNQEIN